MKLFLKILAVLAILASLSIPILSYAATTTDTQRTLSVSCLIKGFAINQGSLEVFVEVNVYNNHGALLPFKEISAELIKSVLQYRKEQGLDRFSNDQTFVQIMEINSH